MAWPRGGQFLQAPSRASTLRAKSYEDRASLERPAPAAETTSTSGQARTNRHERAAELSAQQPSSAAGSSTVERAEQSARTERAFGEATERLSPAGSCPGPASRQ